MNHLSTMAAVLALLAGACHFALASPPAVGTATARGQFFVDSAAVRGNATLLEGSLIETGATSSVLRLRGGGRVTIGSGSRGRVYADRLVLQAGEGTVEGAGGFKVEANALHVLPGSAAAAAHVAHRQPGTVVVAALAGSLRVATAEGILLAALEPGMAREFSTQAAGASAPVSMTGCLLASGSLFRLKDETANVDFELRGPALARYAGQRVTVSGTLLGAASAARVVQVTELRALGRGCGPAPPAAGAGTAASPGSGSTGKAGAGAKTVIAGVAIAAVAGGAALGLTGGEDAGRTISR